MGVPVEEILIVIHIRGIHVALLLLTYVLGGKKLSAECLTD
jgi:hypothetical protein